MGFTPSRVLRAAAGLLAVCLLGAALPARAGEVYTKPEFTITLPDGWVEMSTDELEQFNANIRKSARAKKPVHYQYGFHPAGANKDKPYPYIVARVTTGGRIPEDSLRKMQTIDLNEALKKQKNNLPSFLSRVMLARPLYDPALHTIWVTAQMNVHGRGPVQGLTAIIATNNGFLQVSGWATGSTFASWFPRFHEVMASVVLPRAMRY